MLTVLQPGEFNREEILVHERDCLDNPSVVVRFLNDATDGKTLEEMATAVHMAKSLVADLKNKGFKEPGTLSRVQNIVSSKVHEDNMESDRHTATSNRQDTESVADDNRILKSNTVVLLGHVGTGKSTITRLLTCKFNSGDISFLEKVKADVPDFENLTVFKSSKSSYTFVDPPGDTELVKNVISGVFIADTAVIVFDFTGGAPSKVSYDHSWLAYSLGVKQIVCCCNKMDATDPAYSEQWFESMKMYVCRHLNQVGYNTKNILFVPTTALSGGNVIEKSASMDWYGGPTLIEALDQISRSARSNDALRLPIKKLTRKVRGDMERTVLSGRVHSGTLEFDTKIVFAPGGWANRVGPIFTAGNEETGAREALLGEIAEFYTKTDISEFLTRKYGPDFINRQDGIVGTGFIGFTNDKPMKEATGFSSTLRVLSESNDQKTYQFKSGTNFRFVSVTADVDIKISGILHSVDEKTGRCIEMKPKSLKVGDVAVVEFNSTRPIFVERASDYPSLGRFMLMAGETVIAVGKLTEVRSASSLKQKGHQQRKKKK